MMTQDEDMLMHGLGGLVVLLLTLLWVLTSP